MLPQLEGLKVEGEANSVLESEKKYFLLWPNYCKMQRNGMMMMMAKMITPSPLNAAKSSSVVSSLHNPA
jgi:hypothetical protein